MNIHLTFDIEIWCNGWNNLDAAFQKSFDRYIYGHSSHGDYALPKTLEILNNYGLNGVFLSSRYLPHVLVLNILRRLLILFEVPDKKFNFIFILSGLMKFIHKLFRIYRKKGSICPTTR